MSRALPYLWYPLLFAGAIVAFAAMLAAGVTLVVATYLPTLVAGLAIVALELQFPERLEWRPRRADVAADVAFMALVQILLQRVLLVLAVFAIATWMHGHAPSPWWPHGWTLGAQMVAMLLAVDFMRYWVHRACHTYTPLWRLHEVHHSPGILYTLNVGRFHPLEKILHFACDSVPFLLLGVAPEVIGGYFLLYAVNGFFQHSNLRVRYGWLNYVVGSAETHRWHHARDPRTAYCNFGNTTIVWDLLFRTWYLPTAGPVDDIGIMDTTYPKGFWAQMLTPFRAAAPARRRLARRLADVSIPRYLRLMRLRGALAGRGRRARADAHPERAALPAASRQPRHDIRAEARLLLDRELRGLCARRPRDGVRGLARLHRRGDRARRGRPDAGAFAPVHAHQRVHRPAQGHPAHRLAPPGAALHPAPVGRVSVPRLPRGLPRQHPGDRQPGCGGLAAERQVVRCRFRDRRRRHPAAREGEGRRCPPTSWR